MKPNNFWPALLGAALATIAAAGLILALSGRIASSDSLGTTERVSQDSAANQGNGDSGEYRVAISADGRYVAFQSYASNLALGDTNSTGDIFVHDRWTGSTTRVSVDSAGGQANGNSEVPSVSADGRYVAFRSYASNLVPGDTNSCGTYNCPDIFVHDRDTGETSRVSVDSVGNEANSGSDWPAISGDGRHVAFRSWASNLVTGDTNNRLDVFVHDRQTGATTRVSVDSAGNEGNNEASVPAINTDGRYVAFPSSANNLVAGDTNGALDVFVHDRQTGVTTRVSVDSAGNQGNNGSSWSGISAEGRHVAFYSNASNLVSGDTNNAYDFFVHDRDTGVTERVSVDSAGNQGNGGGGFWGDAAQLSADGRYVAFHSPASNLVAGDTNAAQDVFLRDRQTGVTSRVSVDSAGNEGTADSSWGPAISGDGRYTAFSSQASNLVPGDTNGHWDVFVHDREGAAPTPTPSPTPTPTSAAVGGIAELPDMARMPAGESDSSGRDHIALVGAATVIALVALAAGAWYTRGRLLR